jgi:hypothetical protein
VLKEARGSRSNFVIVTFYKVSHKTSQDIAKKRYASPICGSLITIAPNTSSLPVPCLARVRVLISLNCLNKSLVITYRSPDSDSGVDGKSVGRVDGSKFH